MNEAPPGARPLQLGPGLIAAALVLAVYGGLGLSVDFPAAAGGFKSDEATYYMMTHSLAVDGDLAYRRVDLARVWHEFPAGPTGVFLKKGRTVQTVFNGQFPFVHLRYSQDTDNARLYYGKSYMYPLVAAPFVWLAGTNGFVDEYPIAALGRYESELLAFMRTRKKDVVDELRSSGALAGDLEKRLRDALTEFAKQFSVEEKKA